MPCASFSMLDGLGETGCGEIRFPSSIENDAHGIKKLLLKTQVSEKLLHSKGKRI